MMHRLDDERMREVQFQHARFGRYPGATSMPIGNASVTCSPRSGSNFVTRVNPPTCARCSNVQSEKARDKDNDDDHADDVKNVHGTLRYEACAVSNESTALKHERPGLQVSSMQAIPLRLD
jgi:hypothetical protein